MLETKIWRPNTCGCVIIYQYDSELPPEQMAFTGIDSPDRVTAQCHAQFLSDPDAQLRAVQSETKLYSDVIIHLRENYTTAVHYSFDAARVLTVELPDLQPADKDAIQAWADTTLGATKVRAR